MAQLVLHNEELCKLIYDLSGQHPRISKIFAEDSRIKIKLKTPGILPSVSIAMKFEHFAKGKACFRIETNPLIKLILEIFDMPESDWLKLDASQIYVDVNRIVRKKLENVRITNIQQMDNGQFLFDIEFE